MTQQPMIDVSGYNHPTDLPIDWQAVKLAGYQAVMVKASESIDYVNPWRQRDAQSATDGGLQVGYYHFARPGVNSAGSEAQYALNAIAGLPISLGLALDLEVTEGLGWQQLAEWAKEFHAVVRGSVAHSPLYTPPYFLDNLPDAPWGERLWLPSTARPRREVWAWQATTPARVAGILTPTDVGFLHPAA